MHNSNKQQDLIKQMEKGLDDEFKKNLDIIRPYISCLSDECICLCESWINKFYSVPPHEKYLRNKYLYALWCQLSEGNFDVPFRKFPTNGPLPPLDLQNPEWSDTNYMTDDKSSGNSLINLENSDKESVKSEKNKKKYKKLLKSSDAAKANSKAAISASPKRSSKRSFCRTPKQSPKQSPKPSPKASLKGTPRARSCSLCSKSSTGSQKSKTSQEAEVALNAKTKQKKKYRISSCISKKRSSPKTPEEKTKPCSSNVSQESNYYLMKDDLSPRHSGLSEKCYQCCLEPKNTEVLPEKVMYRDTMRLTKTLLDDKTYSNSNHGFYKSEALEEKYRESARQLDDPSKKLIDEKTKYLYNSDANMDYKPAYSWKTWGKSSIGQNLSSSTLPIIFSKYQDVETTQNINNSKKLHWIKKEDEMTMDNDTYDKSLPKREPSYDNTPKKNSTSSTFNKDKNITSDEKNDGFDIDGFWPRNNSHIKLTNSNGEVGYIPGGTAPYSFENCLFLKNSRINLTAEPESCSKDVPSCSNDSSENGANNDLKTPINLNEECTMSTASGQDFQNAHVDIAFKRRLAEISVIYELRARKLNDKLKNSNKQNAALKTELTILQSNIKSKYCLDESKIKKLMQENDFLQEQLKEYTMETACKNGKIKMIDTNLQCLQTELDDTKLENEKLHQALLTLEENIKKSDEESHQKLEQINTLHKKECMCINEYNNEKINNVVSEYNDRLRQLESSYKEEIQCLKDQHVAQMDHTEKESSACLEKLRMNNELVMIDKNMEISRLENVIQQQCTRLESEVSNIRCRINEKCTNRSCEELHNKVDLLQKQLERMEKLKNKCLKCLEGKFLALLKEKHLQEAEMKSKLMKERAAITVQVFSDSQNELRDAVSRLEERYKMIISTLQEQVVSTSSKDSTVENFADSMSIVEAKSNSTPYSYT